ncbi:MAG: SDR family NAD(P)-dependent oxidoreductase [Woeseiaceae bacterium]|nr:SDR family NAD(P)-dependent oxidoreductase [Woeseiaceae bacterium]
MNLSSFTAPATAVVIGASGGIGAAVRQHLEDSPVFNDVIAFRRPALDLKDEDSIRGAAASIDRPIDLVFVATGVLHTDSYQPEKALRQVDPQAMQDVFAINTIGPALVAKHFLPKMRKDAKSVFAALSARVGSISDNRLGGWVSYRASKAALNMVLKTAAIEHRRSRPQSVLLALHPGTVDTRLSSPFQRGVPDGKLFDPAFSAGKLLQVIDHVQPDDSGSFYAWDGQPITF